MSKITLKDLNVIYQNNDLKTIALNEVNLEFADGLFNVIVGFSGSGKTTLLKAIAGVVLYSGQIYFDDCEISNKLIKDRNISYVTQEFALYPHFTIYDNIAFPLKLAKLSRSEIDKAVREIARELDLEACLSRKPKHLSIGQCQRVAIARSLVKKPAVLLMDEPLSNLDPTLKQSIKLLLKKTLAKMKITTIYVTHDFLDAMSLADQLYVLRDGKIVLSGNPLDIYNSDNEEIKYLKESIVADGIN